MTREILQQALDALETCGEGGYRDIDGDWVERFYHDRLKVMEASSAIRAHLAAPQAQGEPDGWRKLLQQSNDNCVRNFGENPISEWVYEDLAELFSAAPQAQPAHTEAELTETHTTGVVLFPNNQFREAFRKLIDTGDKP